MKEFILLFFIVLTVSSRGFLQELGQSPPPSIKQDLIDFSIGFMVAIKLVEKVPDGFNCVNTLESLQTQVQASIALIRSGKINEGISSIEAAFNQSFSSCNLAASEGQQYFQNLLKEVANPLFMLKAVKRFKENFSQLFQELSQGLSALRSHEFFNSGVNFGKIFQLIVSGNDEELSNFLINEINILGAINWPFNNCGSGPIVPSGVALDAKPAKGKSDGIAVSGTANAQVDLQKVQITTLLNGNPLNTQYDNFAQSFQSGSQVNYKFSVPIPSFAPSGKYAVSFTFQKADGSSAGCVSVNFDL